jgi:hypothetical protein
LTIMTTRCFFHSWKNFRIYSMRISLKKSWRTMAYFENSRMA